jgi:hypothetical protein
MGARCGGVWVWNAESFLNDNSCHRTDEDRASVDMEAFQRALFNPGARTHRRLFCDFDFMKVDSST